MKKYKYVIFDLDGTILDSTEGILLSVSHAIKEKGLKELSKEELLTFIGPPVQESFGRFYDVSKEEIQALTDSFRNEYIKSNLMKGKIYDGIFDLCKALKEAGIKMAVATYKRQDYARTIMEQFGFMEYIEVVYGADHNNKLKKSDIIKLACTTIGAKDMAEIVMIGDSDYDAIGAMDQGIDFIAATYGFGFKSKEDLEKYPCIGIASSPKEMIHYIVE